MNLCAMVVMEKYFPRFLRLRSKVFGIGSFLC
jgi:hypothetical protein